ncbi:GNAT family N-acetyltransferase [Aquimarina sp. 2201CG5-10]|uniref:GNAT family N-acetyltransferase n=1 Tax=Aquimarina callyspongiae TaxID=3098150 RepID=UPI002AB54539|nr:GNAT family N-acetyltransferase [Aquimarina sp. 2201CG5-10]MDY8136242.1 GNAT family N-acetyltransferase [Aquimarina sp. 2201CG5-10]
MNFRITENEDDIKHLRTQLYLQLTAPIDAMWELLYIGSSKNYIIEKNDETIGYCCIDNDKNLLQLFLLKEYNVHVDLTIKSLIESKLINSARLSSNEPKVFNSCLLHSKSIEPNTYCFQHSNIIKKTDTSIDLKLVSENNISKIKSFLKEQIGMDDTFGYTENLVNRKEIYMLEESGEIIATSECRWSDTQLDIADLGVIVHKKHQGKGIATQILQLQAQRVLQSNKKPICSTTTDNIGSKKAIEKAGFYCSNIIFDIRFNSN